MQFSMNTTLTKHRKLLANTVVETKFENFERTMQGSEACLKDTVKHL